MRIVLTGGTGYIGTSLRRRLVAAGHTVTALVRNDRAAAKITGPGQEPVVGDLFDTAWTADQFAAADGVIHTAATGDATTQQLDRSVAAAAAQALSGTGKPYLHTSGIWIYGSDPDITEETPFAPPALTAWRAAVEQIVLEADLLTTIVTPGIVYGYGAGIPGAVFGTRDESGQIPLIGSGDQHWATIHVDDVAALYVTALERGERLGYLIAASGDNPTVREIGEAAAAGVAGAGAGAGDSGVGGAGVAPESDDASRARLGALFADALLLDQQTAATTAKALGWKPTARTLVEEFRAGSYAA
jgi:nucleoside-diphosphate-sugar epimerase